MTEAQTGYEPTGDPDLDPQEDNGVNPGSLLEDLRAEAKETVKRDFIEHRVPQRPNMVLSFDPNFENTQVTHWRRQATTKKGRREDLDMVKFGCIIMAATCQDFIYKGKSMNLTLTDNELHQFFTAHGYIDCVKKMFGSDADIIKAGDAILTAAGYGDGDDEDVALDDDPSMIS